MKIIIVITITLPLNTPPVPPVLAEKNQNPQQEMRSACCRIIRHEQAA